MTEEKKLLIDIDVPWGNIDSRTQLSIAMEIKALLNNNLSDSKDSVSLRMHMLAMALYAEPDEFYAELERLVLLCVVQERVKIDQLTKQAIEDLTSPFSPPEPEQRYEMAKMEMIAPHDGDLSKATDAEIDEYLAKMSDSLSESPHYGEVKNYFNNLADS